MSNVQRATSAVIPSNLHNPARLEHTAYLAATLSVQSAQQATLVHLKMLCLNFVPLVATPLWVLLSVASVQLGLHAHRMPAFLSHA